MGSKTPPRKRTVAPREAVVIADGAEQTQQCTGVLHRRGYTVRICADREGSLEYRPPTVAISPHRRLANCRLTATRVRDLPIPGVTTRATARDRFDLEGAAGTHLGDSG